MISTSTTMQWVLLARRLTEWLPGCLPLRRGCDSFYAQRSKSIGQRTSISISSSSTSCVNDDPAVAVASFSNEKEQEYPERSLLRGSAQGLLVVKEYKLKAPFDWSALLDKDKIDSSQVERWDLQPTNITLPVALLLQNEPETYASLSQARKACRKGQIFIGRNGQNFTGRTGDRVYPGDTLRRHLRLSTGPSMYTAARCHPKPPFDLPVIYEDNMMAIVNKPAGVVVCQGSGTMGLLSVRAALPFVLTPPRLHTHHVMLRPAVVHRLDKPASGLLVVAKTKPAMTALSKQFHDRVVQKTYHAIVLGVPEENGTSLSSVEVKNQYGVDVTATAASIGNARSNDDDDTLPAGWRVIDHPLDDKSAITIWRPVRYVKSLHAGMLTLVEMHPKTGRHHQLRRHMAEVCGTPIAGDTRYDTGGTVAMKFRNSGLVLCATRITLDQLNIIVSEENNYDSPQRPRHNQSVSEREEGGSVDPTFKLWSCEETGCPKLSAFIPLPGKFETLLKREASESGL